MSIRGSGGPPVPAPFTTIGEAARRVVEAAFERLIATATATHGLLPPSGGAAP